jgi:hypothetical protein
MRYEILLVKYYPAAFELEYYPANFERLEVTVCSDVSGRATIGVLAHAVILPLRR